MTRFLLLILWFAACFPLSAEAETLREQHQRMEKLLYSPSRSPYDNNVSLE